MTSSKDKTGDQLVASIRKTKTGSVEREKTSNDTTEKAEVKKQQKKAKVSEKKSPGTSLKSTLDGYSSGRRVWPD